MATFRDTNGKDWTLKLSGPAIKEVREEFDGLNLADDGKAYQRMVDDPTLLIDVLWVLCRKQAPSDYTDIQFGEALVGDAIGVATEAMLEAITDFFPKRSRELLRAVAAKNKSFREAGTAKALEKINDPALEERVVRALEDQMDLEIEKVMTRLSSATGSPASVESVPAI